MSSLNLRLPDSLHNQVRELARRDHISINQFITLAVSEKVSALMTVEYLKERASRGDRAEFERVLDKIARAGREPLPDDRLPDGDEAGQTGDS
jgi:hypothetical protein